MAKKVLGKVAITTGGLYSLQSAYDKLTIVTYNGASYISTRAVPAGIAPTNAAYWQLVAEKGDKGDKGADGLQGNSGFTGAADELEVVNNLTQGGAAAALSAEQGKVLNSKITDLNATITGTMLHEFLVINAQKLYPTLDEGSTYQFIYTNRGTSATVKCNISCMSVNNDVLSFNEVPALSVGETKVLNATIPYGYSYLFLTEAPDNINIEFVIQGSDSLINAVSELEADVNTKFAALSNDIDDVSGKIEEFDNILSRVVSYIPAVTGTIENAFLDQSGAINVNEYGWAVRYQYIKQDCKISYTAGIVGPVGAFISKSIPVIGGVYNLIGWGATELLQGEIDVKAGSYFCSTYNPAAAGYKIDIIATYTENANLPEKIDKLESDTESNRQAALSNTYFLGNRMIDTITRTRWHQSTDGKIGNFIPLAATDKTITLSANDAACISRVVIMACEMADKSCEYAYFSAATGNVITKLYDFNEDIDCRNIVKLQSIHDTTENAYGQHLSPLGSKAFAKDIYRQLGEICQFSDIQFVGGWTAQYCKGAVDYTDTSVIDSYGKLVCQPILDGIKVGGYDACGMQYKAGLDKINAWTHYYIKQVSPNGASITFDITATHNFKGFLRVVCGREIRANGRVVMSVSHNDDIISSCEISQFLDRYIIPLDSLFYDKVSVTFTMQDSSETELKIIEMTLHETYVIPAQYRTIDSTSVVAVLGDSFTQFPGLDVANSLMPSDEFNDIVVRPDGTTGDGCGYYPKELARLSGAVVDNWGKSGETTSWGLEQIAKIMNHKRYTHIIISLFANDINRGVPVPTIISNIRMLAEYSRSHGCVPIILMGYPTESDSQSIGWNGMYDCLTQGFDSPFVYTNSEQH